MNLYHLNDRQKRIVATLYRKGKGSIRTLEQDRSSLQRQGILTQEGDALTCSALTILLNNQRLRVLIGAEDSDETKKSYDLG